MRRLRKAPAVSDEISMLREQVRQLTEQLENSGEVPKVDGVPVSQRLTTTKRSSSATFLRNTVQISMKVDFTLPNSGSSTFVLTTEIPAQRYLACKNDLEFREIAQNVLYSSTEKIISAAFSPQNRPFRS